MKEKKVNKITKYIFLTLILIYTLFINKNITLTIITLLLIFLIVGLSHFNKTLERL